MGCRVMGPDAACRLFLVPGYQRKKPNLPPAASPLTLGYFYFRKTGMVSSLGKENEMKGGRWREAGIILLPLRK